MELSQRTGMTHTALIKIVKRLSDADVIIKDDELVATARSKGGQHVRYKINSKKGLLILINLAYEGDSFIISDFSGKTLYEEKINLDDLLHERIPEERVDGIAQRIKEKADGFGREVLAVSVAVSGQADSETGEFLESSRFDKQTNIKTILGKYFTAPVSIKNDTVVGAIYEQSRGFLKDIAMALYLNIGYGISCCLIHKGETVSGKKSFSGEIGRNFILGENESLHTCCALTPLVKKMRDKLPTPDFDGLISAFHKGGYAREQVLNSARILGNELLGIVNLTGCERIIFSGKVCGFGKEYFGIIEREVNRLNHGFTVRIELSSSNNPISAGLLENAKKTAVNHLFNKPANGA